jgi:hypothetical protein
LGHAPTSTTPPRLPSSATPRRQGRRLTLSTPPAPPAPPPASSRPRALVLFRGAAPPWLAGGSIVREGLAETSSATAAPSQQSLSSAAAASFFLPASWPRRPSAGLGPAPATVWPFPGKRRGRSPGRRLGLVSRADALWRPAHRGSRHGRGCARQSAHGVVLFRILHRQVPGTSGGTKSGRGGRQHGRRIDSLVSFPRKYLIVLYMIHDT